MSVSLLIAGQRFRCISLQALLSLWRALKKLLGFERTQQIGSQFVWKCCALLACFLLCVEP